TPIAEIGDEDPACFVHKNPVGLIELVDLCTLAAQGRPICPHHVANSNDSAVQRICHVYPARSVHEDPGGIVEVIDSGPRDTSHRRPVCSGHIVHPHQPIIAGIRHVDPPRAIHEDTGGGTELPTPAALPAKIFPPAPLLSVNRTMRLLPESAT